jgi:hypothetical protein
MIYRVPTIARPSLVGARSRVSWSSGGPPGAQVDDWPWALNTANAGVPEILSNAVEGDTAARGLAYVVDATPDDQWAECVAKFRSAQGWGGPAVRASEATDTYYVFDWAHSSGAAGEYRIRRVVATESTTLVVHAPASAPGATDNVRMRLSVETVGSDAHLKGHVDGVQVAEITDSSPIASGHVGLSTGQETATPRPLYDDFQAGDFVAGEARLLYEDSFTDTDAVALTAHDPTAIESGGAPLQAGTASAVVASTTSVTLSATAASGGVGPYTYQWHRSTTAGFSPDGSNAVTIANGDDIDADSLDETDTGLTEGTTYYYKLVVTDSADDTDAYAQVSATPSSAVPAYATSFEDGSLVGNSFLSWGTPKQTAVTTDNPRTGTHSLRFSYPDGGSFAEQRWTITPVRELWFEYWVYFPDGTEGLGTAAYAHDVPPSGSNNNKLWKVAERHSGAAVTALLECRPGSVVSAASNVISAGRPMWGKPDDGVGSNNYGMPTNLGVVNDEDLGVWRRWRFHLKVSDEGASNGAWEMWKDDTLLISDTSIANDASVYSEAFWIEGYFFGANNAEVNADTYIWMDDLKFYTSDPGW